MSDNIVSGNKFAFGDPLSASVGVNFNLTVTMPDAYALTGKWATLTVSKFEDGPELFKLSEAGGGLTFSGQNIPVTINNDATNETAGGDTWHTLIESYRNLRFSLDVGDDTDTSNAEYRFQGDISTDPRRGVLPTGLEIGETVTPTLGGTIVQVSLLGTGAPGPAGATGPAGADSTVPGPVGPSGADGVDGVDGSVNDGATTDINGVVFGDGAQLAAATASEIRIAADLDTTDSPTFSGLSLTGDITLSDGATITAGSGTGSLSLDADVSVDSLSPTGSNFRVGLIHIFGGAGSSRSLIIDASGARASNNTGFIGINDTGIQRGSSTGDLKVVERIGSALGNLELSDLIASGNVDFGGLPTSDPAVAGRLYNDSGTLKISAG